MRWIGRLPMQLQKVEFLTTAPLKTDDLYRVAHAKADRMLHL